MKLLQLKYFYVACQFKNITKASEVLHISQPAITKAIRDMEEEFGLTLHHRSNRGFKLTEEGELFLAEASALLRHADQVVEKMQDLGQNRKLLRLGVPPMIGTCYFPDIYKDFKLLYPEIKITTIEEGSETLLSSLDKDLLDIVILPTNEISDEDYNIINFLTAETVFCVSKNNSLAKEETISIDDILKEPLITFQDGYYHNSLIASLFLEKNTNPNIIHSSTQLQTIIQFILNDIASGFLFKEVVNTIPEIKGLSLKKPITIDVGLVFKKNTPMFTDMITFTRFIMDRKF